MTYTITTWIIVSTCVIFTHAFTTLTTLPHHHHQQQQQQHDQFSKYDSSLQSTVTPSSSSQVIEKDIPLFQTSSTKEVEEEEDAFSTLASLSTITLLRSDQRRDAVGKESGTQAASATNWIDEESSFMLKQALNKLFLKLPNQRTGLDRDEASTWIRWMKSTPTPLLIDLTTDFLPIVNATLTNKYLSYIDSTRIDFLNRLGCRLYLFPSGSSLSSTINTEPSGAMIYGKLLFGGIKRYRVLRSSTNSAAPPRKVGEKVALKQTMQENIDCWIQFGGAERMYEAVDMGPAAVLELTLLPQGKVMPSILDVVNGKQQQKTGGGESVAVVVDDTARRKKDMALNRLWWNPTKMFEFQSDGASTSDTATMKEATTSSTPSTLSGKERNEAFASDFKCAVGGLQPQINAIVRRVLDGRIIRPAEEVDAARERARRKQEEEGGGEDNYGGDSTARELSLASMEAEELALLGLSPVRGLLMYGPPGCGKTALAREISRALRARSPKIVSAPELLDRWVGGSEKLVRSLFAEAEAELASVNGDAAKSALHVVVIDEIDAVFRKRTSAEDSGEATRSSAVNQILAKLDGVNAIPNVLLIGMTNRRELLDEALLRPGRLEVQIEIPLPDREGRREILNIHFDALRTKGRLSKPLCCAIDGVGGYEGEEEVVDDSNNTGPRTDIDTTSTTGAESSTTAELSSPFSSVDTTKTKGRKRRAIKRAANKILTSFKGSGPVYDLAADSNTGGFSGADIAGLVRCAGSIALSRARRDGGGVEGLIITLDDVKQALEEVKI